LKGGIKSKMTQKRFVGVLLTFLFVVYLFSISSGQSLVSESPPSKLKVYVGPPKVLANKGVYDSILVQLQDSRGTLARALDDVVVSLSSSKTDIGSVDPTIIIRSGNTYAIANFYSTYTPGSTTITAVASGYTSGQASMTTVGPTPSKLAIYCFPPLLPADRKGYDSIIVQLQDSRGSPARAPIGDIDVTLTSSNTEVGTVDPSLTIRSGTTYAKAKFTTTSTSGTTTITVVASGYDSGKTTMRTSETGEEPSRLNVYVGPPSITAEGNVHESISVQLQDSSGKVVKATKNIPITITSSNIAVGTVDPTVNISSGSTYTVTKFYSTYRSGSTTITAAASGYTSGQASMRTVGPVPSRIAIYGFPPVVPADNEPYSIIVQLQDSSGSPARDPVGDVMMTLSSSNPEIGDVSSTTVIPFSHTYSETEFYSSYKAGSVTITAVAPDYTSAQVTMRTVQIDPPLTVSVTAHPTLVKSDDQATIRIYVTNDALTPPLPVPGATIELTSDKGGSFSSITDERNGYYTATFTAPFLDTVDTSTITASASKTGYTGGEDQVEVTINPPSVVGNVLIYVKDSKGNPVSHATVTSTSQPSGQPPLSGTTDNTGYITFENVIAGYYTIEANKTGYNINSQLVDVIARRETTVIIDLSKAQDPVFSILTLIGWIAIPVIIVVVTILIIKRRLANRVDLDESPKTYT